MNTAGEKIVEFARKEIGYCENPPNTNWTKFGLWFGLNQLPWCGIFVSYCYNQAGYPLGNIGFRKGFAGCQTAHRYFEDKGEITKTPVPGDIVLYDWNGDGRFDHTGIFIEMVGTKAFFAVEGNTSLKNNSNGGSVMSRLRNFNDGNIIFVHPKVLDVL